MKMTMTALLLALAMLPALAQSKAPATPIHDYTFVDVGYQYLDIDVDNISENAHGLGVAGGVQINDWFHLWASTGVSRIEMEYVNVTTTTIGIGMGAHTPLTDNVSAYANVGYVTAEVEVGMGDRSRCDCVDLNGRQRLLAWRRHPGLGAPEA